MDSKTVFNFVILAGLYGVSCSRGKSPNQKDESSLGYYPGAGGMSSVGSCQRSANADKSVTASSEIPRSHKSRNGFSVRSVRSRRVASEITVNNRKSDGGSQSGSAGYRAEPSVISRATRDGRSSLRSGSQRSNRSGLCRSGSRSTSGCSNSLGRNSGTFPEKRMIAYSGGESAAERSIVSRGGGSGSQRSHRSGSRSTSGYSNSLGQYSGTCPENRIIPYTGGQSAAERSIVSRALGSGSGGEIGPIGTTGGNFAGALTVPNSDYPDRKYEPLRDYLLDEVLAPIPDELMRLDKYEPWAISTGVSPEHLSNPGYTGGQGSTPNLLENNGSQGNSGVGSQAYSQSGFQSGVGSQGYTQSASQQRISSQGSQGGSQSASQQRISSQGSQGGSQSGYPGQEYTQSGARAGSETQSERRSKEGSEEYSYGKTASGTTSSRDRDITVQSHRQHSSQKTGSGTTSSRDRDITVQSHSKDRSKSNGYSEQYVSGEPSATRKFQNLVSKAINSKKSEEGGSSRSRSHRNSDSSVASTDNSKKTLSSAGREKSVTSGKYSQPTSTNDSEKKRNKDESDRSRTQSHNSYHSLSDVSTATSHDSRKSKKQPLATIAENSKEGQRSYSEQSVKTVGSKKTAGSSHRQNLSSAYTDASKSFTKSTQRSTEGKENTPRKVAFTDQ